MADFATNAWVRANRDFHYDEEKIGHVKRGQVFQLAGHVNDAQLVDHNFLALIVPKPTKKKVEGLPTCGNCGRVFDDVVLRDICGQAHETPDEMLNQTRRRDASDRAREAVDKDAGV